MTNTFKIYENLKKTFDDDSAKNLTGVLSQIYEDVANTVTKVEFKELRDIVAELAEAQKRTEQRLDSLIIKVGELAEAQTKTEQRLDSLTIKVGELAEAQTKTEKEIRGLAKQVGGLSMAVGYGIEDKYIPIMDDFVLKQYGVVAKTVERKFIEYKDGTYDEINLYIEGETNGKKIYIIGESKAQPGKKDFDRFDTMLKRFKNNFNTELKAFVIGYQFSPEVERYAKAEYPNIDFFKTYQIERIAKKAAV
ncbi:MAG: hypothetical protein ACYCT7_10010 [bacterium]